MFCSVFHFRGCFRPNFRLGKRGLFVLQNTRKRARKALKCAVFGLKSGKKSLNRAVFGVFRGIFADFIWFVFLRTFRAKYSIQISAVFLHIMCHIIALCRGYVHICGADMCAVNICWSYILLAQEYVAHLFVQLIFICAGYIYLC